ncbi:uncharacterized protein MONBRDRAFT_10404 [Monosiga brevicollis MX1]|uniref:TNFR-Cys domain-containing protein n=1 Tax=Monosiga brevicollis TaxID=81824 RepID=A9V642_MONBE|nr:uncharacterized protein MONBRDRAFT_10404 [Monosiga brevicollis MX1]EDQ86921.1 predicted protein [Monosiga brevicollis MX1]|eukprot:XP_001748160.1 hypothetical protein [Monosiga brevicollis MX1]
MVRLIQADLLALLAYLVVPVCTQWTPGPGASAYLTSPSWRSDTTAQGTHTIFNVAGFNTSYPILNNDYYYDHSPFFTDANYINVAGNADAVVHNFSRFSLDDARYHAEPGNGSASATLQTLRYLFRLGAPGSSYDRSQLQSTHDYLELYVTLFLSSGVSQRLLMFLAEGADDSRFVVKQPASLAGLVFAPNQPASRLSLATSVPETLTHLQFTLVYRSTGYQELLVFGDLAVLACTTRGCPCYPGEYFGANGCTRCPAGRFTAEWNASSCGPCPGDLVPNDDRTGCRCPPSMVPAHPGSDTTCAPCPAGTRQHYIGTTCFPCSTGTFSATTGATSCSPCTPPAEHPQEPCPPGHLFLNCTASHDRGCRDVTPPTPVLVGREQLQLVTKRVGNYTIEFWALDATGNAGVAQVLVLVIDTTAPMISLCNGTRLTNGTRWWIRAGEPVAPQLYDVCAYDMTPSRPLVRSFGDMIPLLPKQLPANFSVRYVAQDDVGHVTIVIVTVTSHDRIPPELRLVGSADLHVEAQRHDDSALIWEDPGATALDAVDAMLHPKAPPPAVQRDIMSVSWGPTDVTGPGWSCPTFFEPWHVASDTPSMSSTTIGTPLTSATTQALNSSTALPLQVLLSAPPGTVYQIRYSARDLTGNVATVHRVVTIQDTQAPVFHVTSHLIWWHTDEAPGMHLPSLSVVDAVDGHLEAAVCVRAARFLPEPAVPQPLVVAGRIPVDYSVSLRNVTPAAPAGTLFQLEYLVADALGHLAWTQQLVAVVDVRAPLVVLRGPTITQVPYGTQFREPGFVAAVGVTVTVSGLEELDVYQPGRYELLYGTLGRAVATRWIDVAEYKRPAEEAVVRLELERSVAADTRRLSELVQSALPDWGYIILNDWQTNGKRRRALSNILELSVRRRDSNFTSVPGTTIASWLAEGAADRATFEAALGAHINVVATSSTWLAASNGNRSNDLPVWVIGAAVAGTCLVCALVYLTRQRRRRRHQRPLVSGRQYDMSSMDVDGCSLSTPLSERRFAGSHMVTAPHLRVAYLPGFEHSNSSAWESGTDSSVLPGPPVAPRPSTSLSTPSFGEYAALDDAPVVELPEYAEPDEVSAPAVIVHDLHEYEYAPSGGALTRRATQVEYAYAESFEASRPSSVATDSMYETPTPRASSHDGTNEHDHSAAECAATTPDNGNPHAGEGDFDEPLYQEVPPPLPLRQPALSTVVEGLLCDAGSLEGINVAVDASHEQLSESQHASLRDVLSPAESDHTQPEKDQPLSQRDCFLPPTCASPPVLRFEQPYDEAHQPSLSMLEGDPSS